MSGNFAIKGGGVGPLMANAILNFHFDYVTPSLISVAGRGRSCCQVGEESDRRSRDRLLLNIFPTSSANAMLSSRDQLTV